MIPLSAASAFSDPFLGFGGSGTLRLQLHEVERQLSDCLNCGSSNTTEGKARIQRLEARAQTLMDRVEAQEKASRSRPTGTSASSFDATDARASATVEVRSAPSYASDGTLSSPPGSRLDLTR